MAVAMLTKKTNLEGVWRHRTIMSGERSLSTALEGTKRSKTNLKGVF